MNSTVSFLALMCLFIVGEVACADLAWETVGEIESGFFCFFTLLNIVPLSIYFLKSKKIAVGLVLLLAVFIIPRQLLLLYRWHFLQQEATGIINYAKHEKKRTGAYPPDLSAYQFLRPDLKHHITYSAFKSPTMRQMADGTVKAVGPDINADFGISIYIETPTTPHLYTHSGGYAASMKDWWYYPD